MKQALLLLCLFTSPAIGDGENILYQFAKEVRTAENEWNSFDYDECKIILITEDLDLNGYPDTLLSSSCPFGSSGKGGWGNAGGGWDVYLKFENEVKRYNDMFFNPDVVSFEATGVEGEFILKSYGRISCCEGIISTARINESAVVGIYSEHLIGTLVTDSPEETKLREWLNSMNHPISKYCLLKDLENNSCEWKIGY